LRGLDALIAQEEALLQFSDRQDLNPRALQDYETRRGQLESLAQTIAERRAQMARLNTQLSALRQAWVPTVKAMVDEISARFSEFFAQAKNVGEVQLIEHGDDFDQWELAIMVKFRETEQLQRLSHQRQSGGEKSMSTMLYLLSMQGQSRSPFRVVDEINQGVAASACSSPV
jgi:chromosome segregation ATPase